MVLYDNNLVLLSSFDEQNLLRGEADRLPESYSMSGNSKLSRENEQVVELGLRGQFRLVFGQTTRRGKAVEAGHAESESQESSSGFVTSRLASTEMRIPLPLCKKVCH